MSPWTNGFVLVIGLAPCARRDPRRRGRRRAALRHFATIAPLVLLVVRVRASVRGPLPARRRGRVRGVAPGSIRLATRRGAAHDQQIIVLALLHFVAGTVLGGGASPTAFCFVRLPGRRAGGAGPQPPSTRGRGQLPPGRARPDGPARRRPSASSAAAAWSGGGSSRRRASCPYRFLLFTTALFVALPADRAVAAAAQPSRGRAA